MLLARGPSSGRKRGSGACRGHRLLPGTRLHSGTGRGWCSQATFILVKRFCVPGGNQGRCLGGAQSWRQPSLPNKSYDSLGAVTPFPSQAQQLHLLPRTPALDAPPPRGLPGLRILLCELQGPRCTLNG